jgi:glycosyltransferase involved in cell wall biosynthesis
LLIAGTIDAKIRSSYASILSRPDVLELGYVRDIGAVYRSADVFCFPSWEEGGPMVTIEAMAAGLPCIVTPMGSAGIVSEQTGGALIVEPGDANAIAGAMRRLAADQEARAALGRRARDIAASYTWEQVGQRRGEALVRLREQSIRE